MKTVVGLFDSRNLAQSAIDDLIDSGFQREAINIMASDDERQRWLSEEEGYFEEGSGRAMGRYSILSGGSSSLTGLGVEEQDAQLYAERVNRGGFLVAVSADEANAQKAADILTRYGAIDINEGSSLRQEGIQQEELASRQVGIEQERLASSQVGIEQEGLASSQVGIEQEGLASRQEGIQQERFASRQEPGFESSSASTVGREGVIPVAEEEIEIRESAVEPVVSRQARVKEEVVVGAESSERTAVIQDTLRTDVEVENLESRYGQQDISAMDDDEFMTHFTSTYGGERFDEPYRSAYHFAESESVSHPQLLNKEWFEVEEEVHRDWEMSHPGTWNTVQDAIHFGWDRNLKHHGHH